MCEYVGGETLVERLEKYGADFSEGRAAEITRFVVPPPPVYLLFSLCDILTEVTASCVVIIIITDYYYFCLFLLFTNTVEGTWSGACVNQSRTWRWS